MFGKKRLSAPVYSIPPQVIAIWGPGGNNTASFSLKLAQELAEYTRVLLVELPCLGIPRISFTIDMLDRNNHVEAALSEFWYKGQISLDYLHMFSENLALLPVSPFANPVNPLSMRVELDVLLDFPIQLINSARKKEYSVVIMNCQGQLTHPMTFLTLKNAEKIIVPVNEPSTIAYSLLNIKKLIHTLKFSMKKFMIISPHNIETISEVMWLKNEKQESIPIKVCSDDVEQVIGSFLAKR